MVSTDAYTVTEMVMWIISLYILYCTWVFLRTARVVKWQDNPLKNDMAMMVVWLIIGNGFLAILVTTKIRVALVGLVAGFWLAMCGVEVFRMLRNAGWVVKSGGE